jgi:diguanylate cyclase (GGDEF)-like protein
MESGQAIPGGLGSAQPSEHDRERTDATRRGMPAFLRERLWGTISIARDITVPASRSTMAAAAIWFAVSAVLLAVVSIALPHTPRMDELGLAATGVGAAAMGAVALIGFDRLSLFAFQVGCALAGVTASAAIYFWSEDAFYGPLPYLWPALYAFTFFSLRAAAGQLALIAALYAALLALRDPGYQPVASWAATVVTLGSAGLLLTLARERLVALVAALSDDARRDPLTRLFNRRGFADAFEVELERARRTEQSLSVVAGDLDEFKRLNDSFGHAAGDQALQRVAEALQAGKRSWDTAARIGGEEFAVLAPDTDEHGAYILAERLRAAVEEGFQRTGPTPLTISFGIVSYPVHGQTADALLQAGDQALYAAKRLGRNRSVISSAEVPGILARGSRRMEDARVELATLLSLAEALDVRDSGSSTHCQRVGRYAELIARELGLDAAAVERVRIAGILHDVGRVGVPDALLRKQGPLSEEEWSWVRAHPDTGARMLETTDFADIGAWIGAHHERPDGGGYPDGRGAEEVPLEAAILGVADAYEAMTARRPYRPALDPEAASEELRKGAGRQFDERVVDALLRVV